MIGRFGDTAEKRLLILISIESDKAELIIAEFCYVIFDFIEFCRFYNFIKLKKSIDKRKGFMYNKSCVVQQRFTIYW